MTLQTRLSALERGHYGTSQPDHSALSDADIALLIRVYEGQSITAAERAEARRLGGIIGNRNARPYGHLSDAALAERIAAHG